MRARCGRLGCLLSLCASIPMAVLAAGPDVDRAHPFGGACVCRVVSLDLLDQIRGGFEVPELQLTLSIGLEQAVFVNGELVASNVLKVTQLHDSITAQVERSMPKLDGAEMQAQIQAAVAQQLARSGVSTTIAVSTVSRVEPAAPNPGASDSALAVAPAQSQTHLAPTTGPQASPGGGTLASAPAPVAPALAPAAPPAQAVADAGRSTPVVLSPPPPSGSLVPQSAPAPLAAVSGVQNAPPAAPVPSPAGVTSVTPVNAPPQVVPVAAVVPAAAPVRPAGGGEPAAVSVPAIIVQNGPGATLGGALSGPGGAGGAVSTVVQNSLDNQQIQALTVLDASVNSLRLLQAMDLDRSIRDGVIGSLRR